MLLLLLLVVWATPFSEKVGLSLSLEEWWPQLWNCYCCLLKNLTCTHLEGSLMLRPNAILEHDRDYYLALPEMKQKILVGANSSLVPSGHLVDLTLCVSGTTTIFAPAEHRVARCGPITTKFTTSTVRGYQECHPRLLGAPRVSLCRFDEAFSWAVSKTSHRHRIGCLIADSNFCKFFAQEKREKK